jgi:hypothetical protein
VLVWHQFLVRFAFVRGRAGDKDSFMAADANVGVWRLSSVARGENIDFSPCPGEIKSRRQGMTCCPHPPAELSPIDGKEVTGEMPAPYTFEPEGYMTNDYRSGGPSSCRFSPPSAFFCGEVATRGLTFDQVIVGTHTGRQAGGTSRATKDNHSPLDDSSMSFLW